ncbi:hypothetical protein CV093_15600 [Oceanobacillus sp. 143]|nr:hypothetical protein CV093_15600 [Oceanobacillus sp. 143]
MTVFLFLSLLLNVLIGCRSYLKLRRSRKLFSDRYAMVISMSSSMVLSLVLSLLCSFILPLSFSTLTILSTIVGGTIGIIFGVMVKLHSVLSGFFGGTMGGITGSMVGAVVLDPTLCGLPSINSSILFTNTITFSILEPSSALSHSGLLFIQ